MYSILLSKIFKSFSIDIFAISLFFYAVVNLRWLWLRSKFQTLARLVGTSVNYQPKWLKWGLHFFPTLARLVGTSGLEPPTSRLSGVCSNQLSYVPIFYCACSWCKVRRSPTTRANNSMKLNGGDKRDRTADPLLAGQVLYQLSYTPTYQ